MADENLFEFLHMEIVSHVYKEQQSGKGEMDNKVCLINAWTNQLQLKNNLILELDEQSTCKILLYTHHLVLAIIANRI